MGQDSHWVLPSGYVGGGIKASVGALTPAGAVSLVVASSLHRRAAMSIPVATLFPFIYNDFSAAKGVAGVPDASPATPPYRNASRKPRALERSYGTGALSPRIGPSSAR